MSPSKEATQADTNTTDDEDLHEFAVNTRWKITLLASVTARDTSELKDQGPRKINELKNKPHCSDACLCV